MDGERSSALLFRGTHIATGGVNWHNGIIEGREFARQLTEAGVPSKAIRVEDQSTATWQNVELSLPQFGSMLR
jgi:uncharacterized SAM-binding protein YcdF (DUF218 family)